MKAITDYIRFTQDVNGILDDIVLVGEDRCSLIPNLSREIFCMHEQTTPSLPFQTICTSTNCIFVLVKLFETLFNMTKILRS